MLLAGILPGAAKAQTAGDNAMSYPRLTHCAALNIMLGQVLGIGEDKDKPEVKAQAETFIAQAAALTMVAAAMNQTDPQKVQEDVFAQNEALTQSLTRDGAAEELLGRVIKRAAPKKKPTERNQPVAQFCSAYGAKALRSECETIRNAKDGQQEEE